MGLGDFGAFLGRAVFLTFFLLPDPFLGFCSSSVPKSLEPVWKNSGDFGAFLGSSDLGGFGAFLVSGVFLTFLPVFVAVFCPSPDPDTFLGLCPSLLWSSINSGDPGAFLG